MFNLEGITARLSARDVSIPTRTPSSDAPSPSITDSLFGWINPFVRSLPAFENTVTLDKRAFAHLIIVPLYIYPSSGAWSFLRSSIAANPTIGFDIVVNPSSGPGKGQYPNSDYITAISGLNNYTNVNVLGYVHVQQGSRNSSQVISDISAYNGWQSYKKADIHISGIFVDEAPSSNSTANLNYMNTIYTNVKQTFPAGKAQVITNPGVVVGANFYKSADMINVFEDYYTKYSNKTLSNIPASLRSASSIIIHDFNGSAANQTMITSTLEKGGIGGLFITSSSQYNTVPSGFSQFCSAAANP